MNARVLRVLEGLSGPVDVLVQGARQAANRRAFHRPGNGLHRFEIADAGSGESRFDYIDLEAFQGLGDAHLLVAGHGRTGTLLAVPEGGVENNEFVSHGLTPLGCTAPQMQGLCE